MRFKIKPHIKNFLQSDCFFGFPHSGTYVKFVAIEKRVYIIFLILSLGGVFFSFIWYFSPFQTKNITQKNNFFYSSWPTFFHEKLLIKFTFQFSEYWSGGEKTVEAGLWL